MMFDEIKSKTLFSRQITDDYIQYLRDRKVVSAAYYQALQEGNVGVLNENMILINDVPYAVNCILGKSQEADYDIRGANDLYQLDPSIGTVFSVLYGDSFLFFRPNDERVFFRSLASDEQVLVADSYDDFINKIQMEEK